MVTINKRIPRKVDRIVNVAALLLKIVWLAFTIFKLKFINRKKIIFIYRPIGIGDIVCSFAAINLLKQAHPDHVIIFGTQEIIVPLITLHPDIDLVLQTSSVSPIPRLFHRFFNLYFEPKTSIEAHRGAQSKHLMSDISTVFDVTTTQEYFHISPPADDRVRALDHIPDYDSQQHLLIALCTGPTWAVKSWPSERWAKLTDILRAEYPCKIVQLGAGETKRISGVRDLMDQLNLRECAALISQCDLLISVDSGLLHVSRAVGTKSIGLFGPTRGTLIVDSGSTVIQSSAACTGCHHLNPPLHWQTSCPNNIACMRDLTVEHVMSEIHDVLQKSTGNYR